jgi:hypothetical protein
MESPGEHISGPSEDQSFALKPHTVAILRIGDRVVPAEDGSRTRKTLRSAVFKPFDRPSQTMLLADFPHSNAEFDLGK